MAAAKQNGYDPEQVKSFVQRIENLDGDRLAAHMEYMTRCKEINEQKKEVYDEAKDKGIPKKALKLNVKRRDLERKIEDIRDDLEGDEQDAYDLLAHALGDLDDDTIVKAARERQAKKTETEKHVDSLGGLGEGTSPSKH